MNMIIAPEYVQRNIPESISFGGLGHYQPTTPEYVYNFSSSLEAWKRETANLSSYSEIVSNKHFEAIIALGVKAIPLIIAEVKTRPSILVSALSIITGENPVEEDDYGDFEAMADAWERWAANRR